MIFGTGHHFSVKQLVTPNCLTEVVHMRVGRGSLSMWSAGLNEALSTHIMEYEQKLPKVN